VRDIRLFEETSNPGGMKSSECFAALDLAQTAWRAVAEPVRLEDELEGQEGRSFDRA